MARNIDEALSDIVRGDFFGSVPSEEGIMGYIFATYWPLLLVALAAGLYVGWTTYEPNKQSGRKSA